MPINGHNVGKDVTVDLVTASGVLRATIRTGFSSKQETTQLTVKGADGVNRYSEVPEGWSGTLDYERADSLIDDYVAKLEADYYSGLNIQAVSITETIQEVSGAVSQYRYTGVTLKLDNAGDKMSDQTIKQRIAWRATRRLKIA